MRGSDARTMALWLFTFVAIGAGWWLKYQICMDANPGQSAFCVLQ